ncbi:hypothetical protein MAR_008609, partial [Mya arenaria]
MIKETNGKPAETNTAPTAPSNPGDIDSDVEVDLDEDSPDKMKQNGVSEEAGLYEMLQEYMVENEAL